MNTQHISVNVRVLLMEQHTVLLGQRISEDNATEHWELPGDFLHFGEAFADCAARLMTEKTGVQIATDKLQMLSVTNEVTETEHWVVIGYLCSTFSGTPQATESSEITKWQWWPVQELPSQMEQSSKTLLDRYQALLQQLGSL